MDFLISSATNTSVKRSVNQDSVFVQRFQTDMGRMVMAVLCDGMGGYQLGELASSMLTAAFAEWAYVSLPVLAGSPLEDAVIRAQWSALLSDQNDRIRLIGIQRGCTLGSTVTAMLLTQNRYFLLNVGDTRAYEIADDIRQLTSDHTVVAEKFRRGILTREQAEQSPIQNVLTKCVGVMKTIYPDMFFGKVRRNAVYMLCSDGFRHHITEEEMRMYLHNDKNVAYFDMARREEYLIGLGRERGEKDDMSVITVFAG